MWFKAYCIKLATRKVYILWKWSRDLKVAYKAVFEEWLLKGDRTRRVTKLLRKTSLRVDTFQHVATRQPTREFETAHITLLSSFYLHI